MFDDEIVRIETKPSATTPVSSEQFSLTELFFVTTLLAIELGLYLHVSSLLAFVLAGGFLLAAVIRFAEIHNTIVGSITGYGVNSLVALVYVMTCNASLVPSVSMLIFYPACGYVIGALLADTQNQNG
jgi:hypothetical protein